MGGPSGTVTFLFTDIEGSTRLWSEAPDEMKTALERHDLIVRDAIELHQGYVFSTGGDGFGAAFGRAGDAVAAACRAQELLHHEPWPSSAPVRVRMALHTGETAERGGDYFGPALNEAARLMAVAHGSQVLCSAVTAALLPEELSLVDLGEHRLRDLTSARRIYQVGNDEFPPLRSLEAFRTNLPVQPSRFVGRDEELRRVVAALAQSRLVTLTGVGGVGKTRLALQAAADALPLFPDGVWLVELAGLVDPAMVADAVAAVLGVPSFMGRPAHQALPDFVARRRLLVLLDNCEHVIDAAAEVAERLVSVSESCQVLATSREGLALAGERVVPVPPMSLGSGDVLSADAVRLFVERAAEARDGFVVREEDEAVLAALCRRLDGIPLAIELAAARVRSLAPAEILAHIDRRFRLLSAGRRTAPTRQQTLRGAIDWSYELLEGPERTLLRRLSVFAGSSDLAAIEAVTSDALVDELDVLSVVDRLVDKSLLSAEASGVSTRYRLLETIRDYGLERLEEAGETADFARRHADYFVALSDEAGRGLRGPGEAHWNRVVEVELENLRAALRWAMLAEEADLAVRLVAGLAVAGPRMGIPFGAAAAEAARLEGATGHPLRPLCLASAAWSAFLRGEFDDGLLLSTEALDACPVTDTNDREALRVRSEVVTVATSVSYMRGDPGSALALVNEGIETARALGDPYYLAHALQLRQERGALEEAERLAQAIPNPSTLAYTRAMLATFVMDDDPQRAKELLDEAISGAASVGNEQAGALAWQGLIVALPKVGGDRSTAAEGALVSAERLLGTSERFYGLYLVAAVALSLHELGAEEASRLVAAWLISQGVDFNVEGYARSAFETVADLANRISGPVLQALKPRVASMTDADVIALCRAALKS